MSLIVPQEGDHPAGRILSALGVGWAALTVLSVLVALWVVRERREAFGYVPTVTPQIAPIEIGIVDQTQIRGPSRADALYDAQRERLGDWGWVDREGGVVRLPIDAAMRLVAGEAP